MAEMVVPRFMGNANQIWLQEVRKKNIVASQSNDIWMRTAHRIVHIKQYTPEKKRLVGITIYTFDDGFNMVERLDARTGTFDGHRWQLDGAIRLVFAADGSVRETVLDTAVDETIDLAPEDLAAVVKRSDEMGLVELGQYIEKVEREGYTATRYRVDYQSKIATPFVYLFLSLLGVAIALRGKLREGISVSITIGLGIAFLYWIFNSFCLSLGYAERMPPWVAAWLANLVFFCTAAILLLRTD